MISRNGPVIIVHKGWRTSENKKHSSISQQKTVPQRQEFKDTNADFDTPSVSPPLAPLKTTNVDKRFEFVNTSKSARNRDPEVQKLVRSQVVKDLHRKKPKRPRIQTDTTVEQDSNTFKSPRQNSHSLLHNMALSKDRDSGTLKIGRQIDYHFNNYPIKMQTHMHKLVTLYFTRFANIIATQIDCLLTMLQC